MKIKARTIDYRKIAIASALMMALTFSLAAIAGAAPGHHGYAPGHHVKVLPKGNAMIKHGGKNYYFHNGYYYQKNRNGFVVVSAPIGITVKKLPSGATNIKVGRDNYYNYGGVFYTKSNRGYVVVKRPKGISITKPKTNLKKTHTVRVDSPVLLVRTGPAAAASVSDKVYRGTSLTVRAKTNGFYYVRLPDGSFGWVNSKHTS